MGSLYSQIVSYCDAKGITPYKLCKDIGIRNSVLSDLKSGRKEGLNLKTLTKIANYFDITVDYLIGEEPQEQDEETKSPLQANLIAIRKSKNITQEEMAKFLNVTRQTYSAYERGVSVPDSLTLIKIARYFGVSVDRLASDPAQRDPDAPTVVYMDGGDGPVIHQKPEDKKVTEREKILSTLLQAVDKLSNEQIESLIPVINNMAPKK